MIRGISDSLQSKPAHDRHAQPVARSRPVAYNHRILGPRLPDCSGSLRARCNCLTLQPGEDPKGDIPPRPCDMMPRTAKLSRPSRQQQRRNHEVSGEGTVRTRYYKAANATVASYIFRGMLEREALCFIAQSARRHLRPGMRMRCIASQTTGRCFSFCGITWSFCWTAPSICRNRTSVLSAAPG